MLYHYNISEDVTAFSTTRHGGHSRGAYAGMNINRYCGDNEQDIEKNLEALSRELHIESGRIIMPHQTHGTHILRIADEFLGLAPATRAMLLEDTDALLTDCRNVCIGVSTADCIPVLIHDAAHHAAAAIHAGWRGTVKRIVAKTVDEMFLAFGSRPQELKAIIGPGISADAFEVGDEVYDEFAAAGFDMGLIAIRKDKWHIDLKMCNRRQLTAAGLMESNITDVGICTFNNPDDYFSARRLGIRSGRIYTGVMIK